MEYKCLIVYSFLVTLVDGRFSTKRTESLEVICGQQRDAVVYINSTGPSSVLEIRGTYHNGLPRGFNCNVKFVSSMNNSRIAYSIQVLDIPHACKSFLKLWSSDQDPEDGVKYCEEVQDPKGSRGEVFKGNSFNLWMQTHRDDWGFDRIGFVLTVTALRMNTLNRCLRDEYPCGGGETCLYHKYACDGINNCGDSSDEKCLSHFLSLMSIVLGAILSVIAIGVFICYIRRRRRLRPYLSSRATSMQSIQSDNSLFGTVKETYYKPLYPMGAGIKIKLDELPKDPDEPFLPPQYRPQQQKEKKRQKRFTKAIKEIATKSLDNISMQLSMEKGKHPQISREDEIDSKNEQPTSDTLKDVKRRLLELKEETSNRRKMITRRRSFPPTRRQRPEIAMINEVDIRELGDISRERASKRMVLLPL